MTQPPTPVAPPVDPDQNTANPRASAFATLRAIEVARQERFLRLLIPLITLLSACFVIAYAARLALAPPGTLAWSDDAIEGVIIAFVLLASLAALALRRHRLRAATVIFLATYTVGVGAVVSLWSVNHAFDPFMLTVLSAYGVVIVLTGTLANARVVVLVTAYCALATLLTVYLNVSAFAPAVGSFARGDRRFFADHHPWFSLAALHHFLLDPRLPAEAAGVLILVEIALGGVMFAIQRNFQATLRQISNLYLQITQVDAIKDQFITSVNHELRNPIMAMSGYIDLLRARHTVMPTARRADLLARASEVGERVVSLLMSILDARRLDLGAADFTPELVSVAQAARSAISLINPREGAVADHPIDLEIPPHLVIWGESVRLSQILTNLISNAIKYSPGGAPVAVRASVVTAPPPAIVAADETAPRRFTAPMVAITVRDYGLGIPPDDVPLLFRRFVRLPRDLASNVIGNGLGLHLCKVLTEAMGGAIGLESAGREGEGTTFTVLLPLPPSEELKQITAPRPAMRAAPPPQ